MTRIHKKVATVAVFVLSFSVFAKANDVDALQHCGSIQDDTQRLDCYDNFSGTKKPVEAVTDVVTESASSADQIADEEYVPLTDDIGTEGLSKKDKPEENDLLVRAIVTECRKDSLDNHYFYFENGQVWKQKSDDWLDYRNCNFSVSISKDFFGYKMQIDGEKRRIRISRVK